MQPSVENVLDFANGARKLGEGGMTYALNRDMLSMSARAASSLFALPMARFAALPNAGSSPQAAYAPGSAAVPLPPPVRTFARTQQIAKKSTGGVASAPSTGPVPAAGENDEDDENQDMCFAIINDDDGSDEKKRKSAVASFNPNVALMHTFIAEQRFSGAWSWTATLSTQFSDSGKNLSDFATELTKSSFGTVLEGKLEAEKEVICATAIAVVWFEKRVPEKRDVWEMVVKKAKTWLEGHLGSAGEGNGVEELVVMAEGWSQ